jgi:D-alanine-D-alanine ligase-like ATP-grasp enzyme
MEEYVLRSLRGSRAARRWSRSSRRGHDTAKLRALKPALVFNITECVDGDRRHDHAIAATLDMLGIPYTGTGAVGMQLCRDKALSKQIVAAQGVDVPRVHLRRERWFAAPFTGCASR